MGYLAAVAGLALAIAGGAQAGSRVGTTCFGQPATIVGTDGNDSLDGTPGNDVIVAGDGSDIVFAGAGDDLICGEGGNDFLFGEDGNDSLDGGTGDDAFIPGAGDDKVVDGDGGDLVAFIGATGPVTASLVTGTATGEGNDAFTGVESLAGGPFDDRLTGDAGFFNALIGGPGNDVLDGGPGFDGVLFSAGPVTASLAAGTTTGADGNDTLRNDEGLEGTPADDTLTGDDGTNVIDGRGGNDVLAGLGGSDLLQGDAVIDEHPGNDRLDGGAGDDFLQPSAGSDSLDGGPGRQDLVDFSHSTGGVTANLGKGTASGPVVGRPTFKNIEGFSGSPFADSLTGDKGPNILLGQDGADRLAGGAGDDFLDGGAAADTFDGGTGTDYCLDGRGKGCEFSGVPGSAGAASGTRLAALDTAARELEGVRTARVPPAIPLRPSATGENEQLGTATCAGSTSAGADSVAVNKRTGAGPPHRAPTTKGGAKGFSPSASVFVPSWLAGSPLLALSAAPPADALTWQGALYRFDSKRKSWVLQNRTATAYGVVDPTGTAIWTTASGAPFADANYPTSKGRYAWKATVHVPSEKPVTDWIEPHTDFARVGGGVFAPLCSYS